MSYDLEYGKYKNRPLAYLRDNEPGYADAQYLVRHWPEKFDFVKNTASDESQSYGSPADQANYEFWLENYEPTKSKTWWDLGQSSGILVRLDLLTKEERESYEYLEDNYQLDEDRTYQIEQEVQNEYWNDYERSDFKKHIVEELLDPDEAERLQEFLDAMTDKALDGIYWDRVYKTDRHPGMMGAWDFHWPDADDILYPKSVWEGRDVDETPEAAAKRYQWDKTFAGFIDWIGVDQVAVVKLGPKAFCRLPPEDKSLGYPGARYIRYGEEWVLNVTIDDLGGPASAFATLVRQHADDSNTFIGEEQAPAIEVPYHKGLLTDPEARYLDVRFKFIEEAHAKILQGPLASKGEDDEITDAEVKAQQEFDAIVGQAREVAINAQLQCGFDPADDLTEEVLVRLLLDHPDNPKFLVDYSALTKPIACNITQSLLDKRPEFCRLRQLRLPGVSEKTKSKTRRRRA